MKTKLICKALLAVSFLFLVPNLCFSKGLEGIWKLIPSEKSTTIRYKVFDKAGNYYNVDAYTEYALNTDELLGHTSENPDAFCPCKITRSGSYHIVTKGLYYEQTKYYYGSPTGDEQFPISYRIKGKKMVLLFKMGGQIYQEVYQKVSSLE